MVPPLVDFVVGLRRIAEAQRLPNAYVVRYEDLVDRPVEIMRNVFGFLGVDPSEADRVATWPESAGRPAPFGDQKIHATRGVHRQSVGSNATALSDYDRASLIQGLGVDLLPSLGYPVPSPAGDFGVGEDASAVLLECVLDQLATFSTAPDSRENLAARLAVSEADRAARLDLIHALQAQLATSEAARAAHLDAFHALEARLAASEADRAARLDAIHVLEARLAASEADRAAHPDAIGASEERLG